ncbi:hypothetical protein [Anaerosolibacter sp.]|uniref:hypothetical protein n=1 Tax=Anaerosolibacter sp. TaxID=1872527 RepID=UPI00261AC297|nr:hypothetical protein [Anaerosolibacter sp.]
MKETVEPTQVENVKQYLESVVGSEVQLKSGQRVNILKADLKEKNDVFLIYRYQLVS